jgi:hypothetical protein
VVVEVEAITFGSLWSDMIYDMMVEKNTSTWCLYRREEEVGSWKVG